MSETSPSSPLDTVAEIAAFLEDQGIPYVVMGGLAVQFWGEPRATRDVDVTVLAPPDSEAALVERILLRFVPRIPEAASFARRHRILLVRASNGCPVDISLGIAGYEEEVMRRAVEVAWPSGSSIRMISAEDLIVHKCVAARPRDCEDVDRILLRRKGKIDRAYIRTWLTQFGPLLPHDPLALFEEGLSKLEID